MPPLKFTPAKYTAWKVLLLRLMPLRLRSTTNSSAKLRLLRSAPAMKRGSGSVGVTSTGSGGTISNGGSRGWPGSPSVPRRLAPLKLAAPAPKPKKEPVNSLKLRVALLKLAPSKSAWRALPSTKLTPLKSAPVAVTLVSSAPSRRAPSSWAPLRSAPISLVLLRLAPRRSAPLRLMPLRSSSERLAPRRFTPERLASAKVTSMKRAPLKLVAVPSVAGRRSEPAKLKPSNTAPLKLAPRRLRSKLVGSAAKVLPEGSDALMPLNRVLLKSALLKLTL